MDYSIFPDDRSSVGGGTVGENIHTQSDIRHFKCTRVNTSAHYAAFVLTNCEHSQHKYCGALLNTHANKLPWKSNKSYIEGELIYR
jgi:hypothetical protein